MTYWTAHTADLIRHYADMAKNPATRGQAAHSCDWLETEWPEFYGGLRAQVRDELKKRGIDEVPKQADDGRGSDVLQQAGGSAVHRPVPDAKGGGNQRPAASGAVRFVDGSEISRRKQS